MNRTDAPDNVNGQFVEPDEQTATLGTEIAADWLTDVEENIVRTIEAAGLTPVKGTNDAPAGFNQLKQAVAAIAGRAAAVGSNLLINGGFDLWRRATTSPPSFNLTSAGGPLYTADRWRCDPGVGGSVTVDRIDLGLGLGQARRGRHFALRWSQTVAGTAPRLEQRLELLEELAGQKVALTFAVLSGAGTKNVVPYLRQSFGSGGDPDVEVQLPAVAAVASGWTTFTVVVDVASVAGKTVGPGAFTAVGFEGPSGITFGLAFSAVVLGYGEDALEYPLEELGDLAARAARYFQTSYELGTPLLTVTESGALTADEGGVSLESLNRQFRVPMRTTPALVFVSPRSGALGSIERPAGADAAVTAVFFTSSSTLGVPTTSGQSTGSAFAHFVADAEL